MDRIPSKLKVVVLALIVLGVLIPLSFAPTASASSAFVRQTAGSSSSSSSPTCAFSSSPSQNDLLIMSLSWYPTTLQLTSVTDSLGNSFADAGQVTQGSSTIPFVGDVQYATQTHAAGADTLTAHFASTPTVVFVTCLEFSGTTQVLRVAEKSNTGTTTSGNSFTAALPSFTPTASDLVYAFAAYQACLSSSVTYNTAQYAAGTAKATDFTTGATCRNSGQAFAQNQADQYWAGAAAAASTASFQVTEGTTQNRGTGGWLEIGVEFEFSVAQPVTYSVSPNGAPAGALTLSGCGVSPNSVAGDGLSHTVYAAPSCTVTATATTGTNQRYAFNNGGLASSTESFATCATGTCGGHSVSYYDQVSNTYRATPNGAGVPSWDTGLGITYSGTFLGSTSHTICTATPSAGTTTPSACAGYSDYGTSVSAASAASGAAPNVRWLLYGVSTVSDTSGGNTHDFQYFKQLQNTYQVTAQAQSTFDSGMSWTVTGSQGGTSGLTVCTISSAVQGSVSCTAYSDYGTAVAIAQSSSNPPANSRWRSQSACVFTQSTGGNLDNCNSYKQWSNQWSYSAVSGAPTAPSLTCNQFGAPASVGLTTLPQSIYCDNSAAASSTDPTMGSTSVHRFSDNAASYTVSSGGAAYTFSYYEQYALSYSYSVIDGGTPTSPTLSCSRFGASYTPTMSSSSTAYWCDSGASWGVTDPLAGSGSSERWYANVPASGTVSSNATTTFPFYHQYAENPFYTVVGGGSPGAPQFNYIRFGSSGGQLLTDSPAGLWLDAGTSWSIDALLSSSNSTERWMASGATQGTVQSPAQFGSFSYQNQYFLSASSPYGSPSGQGWYDAGSIASSSVSSPVGAGLGSRHYVTGFAGGGSAPQSGTGSSMSFTIQQPSSVTWNWGLQYLLIVNTPRGSASGGGWFVAGSNASFAVSSTTVAGAPGTQYQFTGWGSASQWGYSGESPSHSILLFGPVTETASWTTQYSVNYTASGCSLQLTVPTDEWVTDGGSASGTFQSSYTSAGSRCVLQGDNRPPSITSPVTVTGSYAMQFLLTLSSSHGDPTGAGWYSSGGQATFSVSATVAGGPGVRYIFANWTGSGSGAYNGTSASASVTMSGPFTEEAMWNNEFLVSYQTAGCAFQVSSPSSEWVSSSGVPTAQFASTQSGSFGERCVFQGDDRPSAVSSPVLVNGTYQTEYLLTLVSAFGGSHGGGWYFAGTNATFGVNATTAYSGGNAYDFEFWNSTDPAGYNGTEPASWVVLSGPVTETASWVVRPSAYYSVVYMATGCTLSLTLPPPEVDPAGSAPTGVFPLQVLDSHGRNRCYFTGDDRPSALSQNVTITGIYVMQSRLLLTTPYATSGGGGWYQRGQLVNVSISTTSVQSGAGSRYHFLGWRGIRASVYVSWPVKNGTFYTQFVFDGPANLSAAWQGQFQVSYAQTGCSLAFHAPAQEWVQGGSRAATAFPARVVVGGNSMCTFVSDDRPPAIAAPIMINATYAMSFKLSLVSPYGRLVGGGWYRSGSTATFSVGPATVTSSGTRHVFSAWSSVQGGYSGTSLGATVVIGGPVTEKASWSTQYLLTVVSTPSWIPSGSHGAGAGWYDSGTVITLNASRGPYADSHGVLYWFSRWDVNGKPQAGGLHVTFAMTGPQRVTARFITPQSLTLAWTGPSTLGVSKNGTFRATFTVTARVAFYDATLNGSLPQGAAKFQITCDGGSVWMGSSLPSSEVLTFGCGGTLRIEANGTLSLSLGATPYGGTHVLSVLFQWGSATPGRQSLLAPWVLSSDTSLGNTYTAPTRSVSVTVS